MNSVKIKDMNTFSAIVVVTFRAKLLGSSAIEEFEDSAFLDCCRADTEEYEYILEAFSTSTFWKPFLRWQQGSNIEIYPSSQWLS